jgi:GNAT superfamily N-acetyltransferase
MSVHSDAASAVVCRATPADAPRIAELSGQLGYPATTDEVARRLRQLEGDARHVVFLAEAPPGQVIGWVHIHEVHLVEADARAEVSGLVIAEGFRGRGAGRILMQHAEQWARERGCGAVLLRSNVVRAGAHTFYDRLGYENIKTQKVFRKKL